MTAHLKNGRVVLDESLEKAIATESEASLSIAEEEEIPTILESLQDFVGMLDGLPSDFAKNHDHYLHGMPKK